MKGDGVDPTSLAMKAGRTERAVAAITDDGLFERLATAILREATPSYRSLVHPGVNLAGKTVKSPLDGIGFEMGADPPRMIAAQHTTTAVKKLEQKWLNDPAKIKRRRGSRATAPAGDVIKTAELAATERLRTPDLRVTLALTTNQEPDEALVRAVEAAGSERGLDIDIWSRSRLSSFLDSNPAGQWIRRQFLGIDQELLSAELLQELSRRSIAIHCPLDDPAAWVPRAIDGQLRANACRDVTFLVAGSGLGKTVACYRMLVKHVGSGRPGLVLPHEIVASASTLQQALELTRFGGRLVTWESSGRSPVSEFVFGR